MVGERDGREAEVNRPLDQPLQARGAVEEAVLRVYVEMNEVALGHPSNPSGAHSHSIVLGGLDEMS